MRRSIAAEDQDDVFACISLHQLAAAADPGRSIRDFAGDDEDAQAGSDPQGASLCPPITQVGTRGNFQDFDLLFEQLASAPVTELGNPLPEDKYLPRSRVGSCPAAHNRALLGEEDED